MEFALATSVMILAASLVAVVVVVARALHGYREQDRALVLGLAERLRPQAAIEIAQADVIRAGAAAMTDAEKKFEADIEEHRARIDSQIRAQEQHGYGGEVAEGRAAMVAAGFDPDDENAVNAWNEQHGCMVTN